MTVLVTITYAVDVDLTPEYDSEGNMTDSFLERAEYAALDKIEDNLCERTAEVTSI